MKRTGLARRAGTSKLFNIKSFRDFPSFVAFRRPYRLFPSLIGIRVGDVIIKINETPAEDLTMLEAQLEIHESGRYVKIFVKGYEKLIAKRN